MTAERLAERILRACFREGLELTAGQAAQLERYLGLLQRWNRVHNLTGLRGAEALIERGIVDSLRAATLLPPRTAVLDVGSGAGFPAVPLAVLEPSRRWVLVEPRRKRANFLEEVRRLLSIDCTVRRVRLEQIREPVPLITSRAVGDIAPQVAQHLLPGGVWVVASTARWIQEIRKRGALEGLVPEDHRHGPEGCWSRLRRPSREGADEDTGGR